MPMPRFLNHSQPKVGTYTLGFEYVDVYGMTKEMGGYFYLQPEEGRFGRIKIGLNYPHWGHVVSVLLHETMEYAALRADLILSPQRTVANDTGNRLFVMDHTKFSELCARVGWFMTDVLPDLSKVYNRYKPK